AYLTWALASGLLALPLLIVHRRAGRRGAAWSGVGALIPALGVGAWQLLDAYRIAHGLSNDYSGDSDFIVDITIGLIGPLLALSAGGLGSLVVNLVLLRSAMRPPSPGA